MTRRRLGSLSVVPLAIAAPALPVITPTPPTGTTTVSAEVRLADIELWGMGGSGTPIPSQSLIDEIWHRFVDPDPPYFPGQPQFPVDSAHPLFTPEGLYPAITTGVAIASAPATRHVPGVSPQVPVPSNCFGSLPGM